jgi:predicted permease
MFQRFASLTGVFSDVAAMAGKEQLQASVKGTAQITNAEFVTGNYFQTLGVTAALGRTLEPSDDNADAEPVAVLSYAYWRTMFAGDPAIIGASIRLSNSQGAVVVTVVGVVSNQFPSIEPGSGQDIWLPRTLQSEFARDRLRNGAENADEWWLYAVARLRRNVSLPTAQSAADSVFQKAVLQGSRKFFAPSDSPHLLLRPAQDTIAGWRENFAKPLTILMFAAGLILLISCANLAGLMLARMAARSREMAMQSALGAGRARIIRQLLTESLLLGCLGGALGWVLALWSARTLAVLITRGVFRAEVDAHVLLFSVTITLVTVGALIVGAALRSVRRNVANALSGNAVDGGRRRFGRAGDVLVVGQVSLCVVLLTGAGLLVRTLKDLRSADPGFDTANLLLVTMDPGIIVPRDEQLRETYIDLYERFRSLPGVIGVSYSGSALLSGSYWRSSFSIPDPAGDRRGISEMLTVGPGFFETMRIPFVAGRILSAEDYRAVLPVQPTVVNRAFAREFFGAQSPIGKRLTGIGKGNTVCEIVGIVADANYTALRVPARSIVYVPQVNGPAHFEIRTAESPEGLIAAVRREAGTASAVVATREILTQREQIDRSLLQERIMAPLSSFFGLLALLLACIGLYGLLAYEVTRGTREIGIRMALGAQAGNVLRSVVARGVALAIAGAVLGTAVSMAVMRYLGSMLFGVNPTDPLTLASVVVLLLMVALAACYIPARRAMRVDPMVALRHE